MMVFGIGNFYEKGRGKRCNFLMVVDKITLGLYREALTTF
jgi:hypothetical protein